MGQRVDRKDGNLQHRPHHTGADRLQQAADQHQCKGGAQPGEHGSGSEDDHRSEHDLTGRKTAGQICRKRNHHAHDELENRRQPLSGRNGNAEIGHNGRQSGAQLQLREVANESDERQNRDGNECRMRQMAVGISLFTCERLRCFLHTVVHASPLPRHK